ncbi:Aste57867_24661 [Aphanomyces stellatus]|uniref:Aste57867_24661 protein n=1 Tax=Aphanomyces stellatus TaxID=120398 RepID=A0A485LT31_9STRA|nr:hypothetical protein As57867_024583 [Aphanomyces stellatus]VFU01298.1 Aste57867_24661 [Aphanomyces stellatus]
MVAFKAICVSAAVAAVAAAENNTWVMKAVNSIQARVQAFAPVFDIGEGHKTWVADFVKTAVTFQDRYRVSMDTINTASVEGALMYLQAEGIDAHVQSQPCVRKNNMSYIWFYNITIVQPTLAIAEFQDTQLSEYGPFVAMDNGFCTPISASVQVPAECLEIDGLNNYPKIGAFIGGEPRKDDARAPYDENIWFSYPNSCYLKTFDAKNEECRKKQTGGMCPRGVQPDGINCTFSFEVMGFLAIDELVGITSMKNSNGQNFTTFNQFCKAGNTEYTTANVSAAIPFWQDPFNRTANAARSKAMMDMYNAKAKQAGSNMIPLPDVKTLTDANPPCYVNSKKCSTAAFGCRRKLLAQVCEVCSSAAPGCVKKPSSEAAFPALIKAERKDPNLELVTNTTGAFGKNATASQNFVPGKPQAPIADSTPGAPGAAATGSASSMVLSAVAVVVAALAM